MTTSNRLIFLSEDCESSYVLSLLMNSEKAFVSEFNYSCTITVVVIKTLKCMLSLETIHKQYIQNKSYYFKEN